MRSLGYRLLASVCVGPPILFGALAAPALAQDKVRPAPGDAADAASDAAPDVDASEGGDIVVTATRRSQSTLSVPVAVSTYAPEQIARSGISDVKRLTSIAPSLDVSNTQGETSGVQIRVRGVGTSGSNPGLESATGVSVDGVFLIRSNVALGDLLGIERIELLRGPQGTLFGKNTTAGVVNIITAKPSFTPGLETAVSTGNYDYIQASASLTGPLAGDMLAGRIDAIYTRRDGWLPSTQGAAPYINRNRYRLRGQLLFTPSDEVTLRLIADYASSDENSQNPPLYRTVGPTGAALAVFGPYPIATYDAPKHPVTQIDAAGGRFDRMEDGGVSVGVDWKVGPGTLTSVTGYRSTNLDRSYDVEGSPADIVRDPRDGEKYRTFSQELRYQGVTGPLDYLVGAYFSDDRIHSRDTFTNGRFFEPYVSLLFGGPNVIPAVTGLPAGQSYPEGAGVDDAYVQRSRSFALFTHNSVNLTDRLSITGGLRWTTERKKLAVDLSTNAPGCVAALPILPSLPTSLANFLCGGNSNVRLDGHYDSKRQESAFSGTAAANWRITDQLSTYASFSRGYKAGGFQYDRTGLVATSPDADQLQFGREMANAYEIGLKSVLFDRALRTNVALFHTTIDNYQFNYLLVTPTSTRRVTANLPKYISKGAELETSLRIGEPLTLSAAVTYQDVEYGGDLADYPAALAQLHATRAPFAPKWIVSGSINVDQPIGGGLKAFLYLDARYQSRANLSYSATTAPDYFQDGYALVNGRIGIGDIDGRITLEAWARNLFNKRVWTGIYQATAQTGSIAAFINEPRFYGLTLRSKF